MKVLVTGATGLLGNNLVRLLLTRGYEVRCFLRDTSSGVELKGLDVEIYRGNLLNEADILKAVDGCEVVIHAAAKTEQYPVDFKYYQEPNVTATKKVIEAVKIAGVTRFVFVSTANVFGPGSKEQPGTEWSEFSHFNLASGYINSKYLAQEIVKMEVERNGLPAIIVNPTFMLGGNDFKPSSGQIIKHALKNLVVLHPVGGKNFVHVDDVAEGIINSITEGRVGESYLLAGANLTYKEFFEKVLLATGKKKRLIEIHPRLLSSVGRLGDAISFFKPTALNTVSATLLNLENYYSAEKAIKELNMPQTPIDVAIADALQFFKGKI